MATFNTEGFRDHNGAERKKTMDKTDKSKECSTVLKISQFSHKHNFSIFLFKHVEPALFPVFLLVRSLSVVCKSPLIQFDTFAVLSP
ncbi:MAG: hypothetical protein ACK5ES_22925, partial [Planctomyces sp.]